MGPTTHEGGTWSAGVAERSRNDSLRHVLKVFVFCASAALVGMVLGYLFIDRMVPNLSDSVYTWLYSLITSLNDFVKDLR